MAEYFIHAFRGKIGNSPQTNSTLDTPKKVPPEPERVPVPAMTPRKLSANDESNHLLEDGNNPETTHFKYAEIWQRAKRKIVMNIRMKKFFNNIRIFGPGVNNEEMEGDIENYFKKKKNQILTVKSGIIASNTTPFGVFHPSSGGRILWNCYIGIVLVFTAIFIPYSMAFINSLVFDTWWWMNTIIDFSFLIDFLMNLNTAYIDTDGVLVTSRWKIFLHYLQGWLILDLISAIPFGFFEAFSGQNESSSNNRKYSSLVRLFRLKGLPKLLRMLKAMKVEGNSKKAEILETFQHFFNLGHTTIRFVSTVFGLLVALHCVTCFWYICDKFDDFGPDTWVVRYGYIDSDHFTIYLTSMYWALTTLVTLGYGDITPLTLTEKSFTMCWMVISMYALSFVVSSLSSMFAQTDIRNNQLTQRLAEVDEFVSECNLSKEIQSKMHKVVTTNTEQRAFSVENKENLLYELPMKLKYEIAMNMYHSVIKALHYFNDKEENFIAKIMPLLQPFFVQALESIYSIGENSTDIMFIMRGRCQYVYGQENTTFKVITEGQHFGDIETVLKTTRKYNVQSSQECNLLVMGSRTVQIIEEEFPEVWKTMVKQANENDKKIRNALAEMKILLAANKEGNISSMTSILFKELLTQEVRNLKNLEDNTPGNSKFDFVKTANEKIDNLHNLTSENAKIIEKILRTVKELKNKKENNIETRQALCVKQDQSTQTIFED